MVVEFTSILLAVIAAVYVGFSLADDRESIRRMEIVTAIVFIILALLGLWVNPWLLVTGYIGHGIWDWLHHTRHVRTEVVGWYPPFCAIYDFLVGLGILFWI